MESHNICMSHIIMYQDCINCNFNVLTLMSIPLLFPHAKLHFIISFEELKTPKL